MLWGSRIVSQHLFTASYEPDVDRQRSDRVWHVIRAGRVDMLTTWELALAARYGLLSPDDQIWRAGLPRSFVVSEIEGLLPRWPAAVLPELKSPACQPATHQPAYQSLHSERPHQPVMPAPLAKFTLPERPAAHLMQVVPLTAPAAPYPNPHGSGAAAVNASSTSTLRMADSIAHHIVSMLDRYDIKTLDDMTSDLRLRQSSEMTFELAAVSAADHAQSHNRPAFY